MLGAIGCLLAFLIVIFLCYKNWSIFLAAIAGAIVVIVFNGLPVLQTFTEIYFPKLGSFVIGYFAIFLFGAIQAAIYTESGAALSIAESFMKLFMKNGSGDTVKHIAAIMLIVVIGTVLSFGGILTTIVVILLYPIALAVFEKANIPKKFILGVLACGTFTFALTAPGSPQVTNIVAMNFLGTSSSSGLVAGIIASVVEIAVTVVLLNALIVRAKKKGERFEYGPKDVVYDSSDKKPLVWLAVIPLLVLFVMFNFFKIDILICLPVSCVLSVILFFPFLKKKGFQKIINNGAVSALPSLCTVAAVVGFAGVVVSTDSFQMIIQSVLGFDLPPVVLLVVCVAIMCALTGGSATGLTVCLPVIGTMLVDQLGLAPELIHRVSVFAATTLDTLPYSGAILMFLPVSNMKLKEVYPATFVTTVVATVAGTVVVALLMSLFPALP